MKVIRYAGAALTVLMSLFNLPAAFSDSANTPSWLGWAATFVGVAGLIAAVALLRRIPWGAPAVAVIGGLNLLGGGIALQKEIEGAVVGIVLGAVIAAFGFACATSRPAEALTA